MRNRDRTGLVFVLLVAIFAVPLAATPYFLTTLHPPNVSATSSAGEMADHYGPVSERVFAQPEDIQEVTGLPPVEKDPPEYPNLDSNLNRLAEAASAANETRTDGAESSEGETAEPVLVTFYIEPEQVDNVRVYLEDNGVFVRNVGDDYIEAHVPPSLLGAASERPGVLRVDTVIPPRTSQTRLNLASQGVSLHGAEAWHDAGYRGNSVRVGVIDSGFEGFSRLQGTELPSTVTARCYFSEPRAPSSSLQHCEVGTDHGTLVAETLIDVAPAVDLYIANPLSKGDMRDAVDWMVEQGVRVINQSRSAAPDGPGDGTSPFSDSNLRTVDAAVEANITWINSAGNDAQAVWYGTFSDPDDNGWHNFTPRRVVNAFQLKEGDTIGAFMRWDDSWERADCDLDLVLAKYIPDSEEWVQALVDDKPQDGTAGDVPLARILTEEVTAAQSGVYAFAILKHTCTDDPAWIQLTSWDHGLQYYSPGHHIGNPAESRNPGILAVGATHYTNTRVIASYSSRGPTLDGRIKPDITGVACGRSTVVPARTLEDGTQCWFPGTSQSAPHLAGLAALVQQRFPGYTPLQLTHYLRQNAAERGAVGVDNTWGHGLATLPDPSVSLAPTTVGMIADLMLTVDQMSTMDVSMYFRDADDDMLTYTAGSSDAMIATATVSGTMLTIEGKMDGTATITVYALAGSGTSATQTFDVMVTAELRAPMNVRVNPVGSGLVTVDWDRVPNAAGYTIVAVNIANSAEVRTKSVNNPHALSGQIGNLEVGAQYNIYVGSFDANLDFAIDFSEKKRVTVE